MVLKYASQIAALNAAIAKLDGDLASNPNWRALHQSQPIKTKTSNSLDPVFTQLHLEQELARDPVYRVRVRLLEAVQVLQQIPSDAESACTVSTDAPAAVSLPEDVVRAIPALPGTANKEASGSKNELEDRARVVAGPATGAKFTDDDLTRIRGVTPSLNERLKALGMTRFSQIASWTSQDRQKISEQLGLEREILRQNWIDQAALLASKSTPSVEVSAVPHPVEVAQPQPATVIPRQPSPPAETPHILIKSAAHGLVRRLQASNDPGREALAATQPQPKSPTAVPVAPATPKDASIKPQTTTPLRPQSQIVFAPQVVPEPRRTLAAHERQQKECAETALRRHLDSKELSQAEPHAEARAPEVQAPQPKIDQRIDAVKPVLPKDQLRFRRSEAKTNVSVTAEPTDAETIVLQTREPHPIATGKTSKLVPEVGDADVEIRKSTLGMATETQKSSAGTDTVARRVSQNPLSPPPVPEREPNGSGFKKRRWLRKRGLASRRDSVNSNFGDGQHLRHADPILTGPALDDAATLDPKIYAHGEEASVEIVRTRPNAGPASEPPTHPPRIPPEPSQASPRTDETAKPVLRHPAKRIFKALKRE